MGLFRKNSESRLPMTTVERVVERIIEVVRPTPGNPNPANYKVSSFKEVGNHLVILLIYPDCLNYEGKKILLFENCKYTELTQQKLIDPHFSTSKGWHSPIARFEPTPRGWEMAVEAAKRLP